MFPAPEIEARPAGGSYEIPRYRVEGLPSWYHVLHGTVPGHQIDFMYCPEVPQGRFTQTHFGHLARLMKYIEPREGAQYAFALGNLSRDDVQHEPGHGGVALIFGLRVSGVTDHAGRAMPPYAHGVLAIDRHIDYVTLLEAAAVFYRRFLEKDASSLGNDETGSFYRTYVHVMREQRDQLARFLGDYVEDFDELPQPGPSQLGWDYVADEENTPKRVTIVHAEDEPFTTLAHAASAIGAVLYRSNIKWTSLTSGREIEIPGGMAVRFVPQSQAPRDPKGALFHLDDLPDDEASLAEKLFHAKPRNTEAKPVRVGWRQALGERGQAPSNRPPSPAAARSSPPAASAEVSDDAPTIPAQLVADDTAPATSPGRRPTPAFGVQAKTDFRYTPAMGIPAKLVDPKLTPPIGISAHSGVTPQGLSIPGGEIDVSDLDAPEPRKKPNTILWIGLLGALAAVVAVAAAIAASSGEGEPEDKTPGTTGTAVPSTSPSPTLAPTPQPTSQTSAGPTAIAAPAPAGTATAAAFSSATPSRTPTNTGNRSTGTKSGSSTREQKSKTPVGGSKIRWKK